MGLTGKNKGTYRDSEGYVHRYAAKKQPVITYAVEVTEKGREDRPMTAYFKTAVDAKHFASYYRGKYGYKVKTKKYTD